MSGGTPETGHGPVRGLVFDKDGTLFDFQATWAGWALGFLRELAQGDDALLARLLARARLDPSGPAFLPDSPVIAGTALEVRDLLLAELPGRDPARIYELMNRSVADAPVAPAVPLAPLLRALSGRGLRLGVATNDAEAPARAHLGAAGVAGAFDMILGCDSGHGGKPAPGQILAFCAAYALDPGTVVMVGDSLHDLHAARAAGARPVAVLTGVAGAPELAPHAEAVLPDIGHLPDWLDSQTR